MSIKVGDYARHKDPRVVGETYGYVEAIRDTPPPGSSFEEDGAEGSFLLIRTQSGGWWVREEYWEKTLSHVERRKVPPPWIRNQTGEGE